MTLAPSARVAAREAALAAPPLTLAQKQEIRKLMGWGGPGAFTPRPAPPPEPTWVYRHYDADGHLLYVGISSQPDIRLRQHKRKSPWRSCIARVETVRYESREEAMAVEKEAIQTEHPVHNKVYAVQDLS